MDLPIECSFLIPLIKCWESLVCLIEKTWVIYAMCDWENLEGNFIDRHTVQRDKYLEGNLPRQTFNDICSLNDGSSPRMDSQKLGQPSPATFMYKRVFYLSGGVFACDKLDWVEKDLLLLPFFPIYFGHLVWSWWRVMTRWSYLSVTFVFQTYANLY